MNFSKLIGAVLMTGMLFSCPVLQAQDRATAPAAAKPTASGPTTLAAPKPKPQKFYCNGKTCSCGKQSKDDCSDMLRLDVCKSSLSCDGDACSCTQK